LFYSSAVVDQETDPFLAEIYCGETEEDEEEEEEGSGSMTATIHKTVTLHVHVLFSQLAAYS